MAVNLSLTHPAILPLPFPGAGGAPIPPRQMLRVLSLFNLVPSKSAPRKGTKGRNSEPPAAFSRWSMLTIPPSADIPIHVEALRHDSAPKVTRGTGRAPFTLRYAWLQAPGSVAAKPCRQSFGSWPCLRCHRVYEHLFQNREHSYSYPRNFQHQGSEWPGKGGLINVTVFT